MIRQVAILKNWNIMANFFSKIRIVCKSTYYTFILFLPNELSPLRVRYYNARGCKIHKRVSIASNVHIKGTFEMGEGSSIAQNCSISGESAGVFIGKNVMIAPNVVIVAFNHGYADDLLPMALQSFTEAPIYIEDDVWIASNCTIVKGIRIGKGSIIGANSFVNKDVPPFSIMGGVPAKLLRSRVPQ